MNSYVHF